MNKETKGSADRLLKLPEVERVTSLHRATIYRRIKAGSFPKQRKLGTQTSAWLGSEIDAWLSALPT